jgi:hypothetical protein
MAGASRRELLSRRLEVEISRMECLIGHFAAEAALASARGRARRADEARATLATAAEVLLELRALRERLLRCDQAGGQ